jgi:glycosyltransferase involved in cell wall biosynthesis
VSVRVIEPNSSGHRLYYVRVLAEGSREPVEWVTTLEAASSGEARVHLQPLMDSNRLTVRVLEPWPSKSQALARTAAMGDVAVPDGDRWLGAVAVLAARRALRPRVTLSACRLLLMRPHASPDSASLVSARFRRTLKSALVRVVVRLRPLRIELFGLVDAFGNAPAALPYGIEPVADPVLPRSDVGPGARSAGECLVVGLLGSIDLRKNPALVAAACHDRFSRSAGRLLVVGGVGNEAAVALESGGLGAEQLSVDNRYVSDEELFRAAAACDVLALMYDNHESSSGVLALAAQAGAAVVVPRGSRLAEVAVGAGFGVLSDFTVAGVSAALAEVADRRVELSEAAARAGVSLGTRAFVSALAGPAR